MSLQFIAKHSNSSFLRSASVIALLALSSTLVAGCAGERPRAQDPRPLVPELVNVGVVEVPFGECEDVKVKVVVTQADPSAAKPRTLNSKGSITGESEYFQERNDDHIDFAREVTMCFHVESKTGDCPFVTVGKDYCFTGVLTHATTGANRFHRPWSDFKEQ